MRVIRTRSVRRSLRRREGRDVKEREFGGNFSSSRATGRTRIGIPIRYYFFLSRSAREASHVASSRLETSRINNTVIQPTWRWWMREPRGGTRYPRGVYHAVPVFTRTRDRGSRQRIPGPRVSFAAIFLTADLAYTYWLSCVMFRLWLRTTGGKQTHSALTHRAPRTRFEIVALRDLALHSMSTRRRPARARGDLRLATTAQSRDGASLKGFLTRVWPWQRKIYFKKYTENIRLIVT